MKFFSVATFVFATTTAVQGRVQGGSPPEKEVGNFGVETNCSFHTMTKEPNGAFQNAFFLNSKEKQNLRMLDDSGPSEKSILFQGDGCIDYYPNDIEWVSLPYKDGYNYLATLGFPFTFGERIYTDVMINSNGHVHFDFDDS